MYHAFALRHHHCNIIIVRFLFVVFLLMLYFLLSNVRKGTGL